MIAIDCEYNDREELLILSYKLPNKDTVAITDNFKECIETLLSYDLPFVGHNIKADVYIIYVNTGILLTNVKDTMILAQLLTNGYKVNGKPYSVALDSILNTYGIPMSKDIRKEFIKMYDKSLITESHIEYAKGDVKYLVALYNDLYNDVKEKKQDYAVILEEALIPILVKMETKPVLLDTEKLKQLEQKVLDEKNNIIKQIVNELNKLEYQLVTKEETFKQYKNGKSIRKIKYFSFNINSVSQIKEVYNFFRVELPLNDDNKPSTNSKILEKWIEEDINILTPFTKLLLEYRSIQKLYSSYAYPLVHKSKVIDKYKYTNTVYQQCFTVTHRLSSSSNKVEYKTNLQNIPSRGKWGKLFKECFITEDGRIIISCDMEQAELRIAADASKDKNLISVFKDGVDVHCLIATEVWKVLNPENNKEVTSEYPIWKGTALREVTKLLTYGLMYGAGVNKVAEIYGVTNSVASKIVDNVNKKLSGLTSFIKNKTEQAKKNKFVTSNPITNRIRYTTSPTESANYYFQATNGDMMKEALIRLDKYITTNNVDAYLINTIHDSVYVSIKEGEDYNWVEKIMAESMDKYLTIIEGKSKTKIGKYWQ